MMKPATCNDGSGCSRAALVRHSTPRSNQRGDMLLESLIGALLMLAIGLGLTYSASRMVQTQRETSVHSLALQAVRNQLQTVPVFKDFCDDPQAVVYAASTEYPLALSCSFNASSSVEVSVDDGAQSALTITVNDVPSAVQLTATAPESLGSTELLTIQP